MAILLSLNEIILGRFKERRLSSHINGNIRKPILTRHFFGEQQADLRRPVKTTTRDGIIRELPATSGSFF